MQEEEEKAEGDAEVFFDGCFEDFHRVDHMVFYGIARNAELSGDFVVGQLLFAAEAEDFAGARGKVVDGASEEVEVFPGQDPVIGGAGVSFTERCAGNSPDGGLATTGGLERIECVVTGNDE